MLRGFDSIREAKAYILELEVELEELNRRVNQIIYAFDVTYQGHKIPARLTKAQGRGLVWRCRASSPVEQIYFTFRNEEKAGRVLSMLPLATQRQFFKLEKKRANINLAKRNLEYELRLIREWIELRQAFNRLKTKWGDE